MSVLFRRLFLCLIGILAGLAAWPFAEVTLLFQSDFTSYLFFTIFLGMVFGLVVGGFFGSSDGVIMSIKMNVFSGMLHGALIGVVGGIVGFLIGQAVLFIIGDMFIHSMRSFNTIGLPISRAVGWAMLGIFIGLVDGVRLKSFDKIKVGIIGGIIGGFLGGLALEYLRLLVPGTTISRLIGLLIFGLSIGFFYGLVENRLSYGVLRLLNGKYKGKEFLVNQRKMGIGSSDKNSIVLTGYKDINDSHADLLLNRNEVIISTGDPKKTVLVNDDKISKHQLKMDDVVKIGSAKLLFKFK